MDKNPASDCAFVIVICSGPVEEKGEQQEKELKVKTSTETSLIWEVSSLKKELQKTQIKLNHLQTQQSAVKAVLHQDDKKVATKRRNSIEATEHDDSAVRVTRHRSKVAEEAPKPAKKPRNDSSALMSAITGQENDARSRSTRSSTRKSTVQLDKSMPDNPFAKKASLVSSWIIGRV